MRAQRGLFALLAAGMLSYVSGSVLYAAWLQHLDPPPYPSWSDVLWLANYVLLVIALGRTAVAEIKGLHGAAWLDAAIGGLGVGAAGSTLGLRPILESAQGTQGNATSLAVNAAYPVADLLLAVFVVGVLALTGGRPAAHWAWFGAGLLTFAAADTWYLVRLAETATSSARRWTRRGRSR